MAPMDDDTAPVTAAASTSANQLPGGDGSKALKLSELPSLKLGTLNLSTLESAAAQQNLQVLDLKDNKIAAIPAEVFRSFVQVKVLDVRKNALEELSPAISVMVNLEDLLADQNRLRDIPVEVCKLPNLRSLSLSQNVLKGLPRAIGELTKLRSLSLGDNHINDLPPEIGACKDLQTLYIHHNHFIRLPTSLGQLKHLSELALEWFRYTTPPLPRVIKGSEWKRIIDKLTSLCQEKGAKGESYVSCIEVLAEFSQKSFDPNAIDSKRRTRLHVACLEGHVGVAMSLAENGSKCDSLDCEGYSPLLVAVREEHPDIATALVRVGVDVNRGGGLFGSPLHVATVNFDPHMVLLLINGRADVNQTDADGNTPLHVLMSVFDKGGKRAGAIGQILLRHDADCNMMNSDKWAPLHLAARRGQLRGICFVLSHIDSVEPACLKGECSHLPSGKKSKNSRVRTCPQAFDLNLRGGSHLWTPLHLAGHACHVPVVQVLIEAGANVFLRNIDSRTARHVSRGNLAISKLLRKAEDEWLWYRIHQGAAGDSEMDGDELWGESARIAQPAGGSADDTLLDALKADEGDDDDMIEEIAKNIEGSVGGSVQASPRMEGKASASKGPPAPKPRPGGGPGGKMHRIVDKCRDVHFNKSELQALQHNNFTIPCASLEDFSALFVKVTQQGPKHRLPLLLSKQWAKDMLLKLLEDEASQDVLLHPSLVSNEDFIRLLVCNIPREQLTILGKLRNSEQEALLHILCKSSGGRAYPTTASLADILSFLLSVCPPETFDLEAQDHRGQTSLHLAVQAGDLGLVQTLLEGGANPNAQEETTGWTPLHFAVAKSHYTLILQLLHHDATNVNQVDKFDWPPLLEACSRLDARATSLLVNGGANLGFRNQHQFDVLKAVDTSKKDLAAKRWMSCLVVSNGFRFEESKVQLNLEDRQTLEREKALFSTRTIPTANPPFFVPDHLAPRCHSCKVLFTVTVRRYHCRSCGLVLCGDCFKWRGSSIVALDERLRSRQLVAQTPASLVGLQGEDLAGAALNEGRLNAAVEMSMRERAGLKTMPGPKWQPTLQPGQARLAAQPQDPDIADGNAQAAKPSRDEAASPRSEDSDEPPLAEELPAVGPPLSVVCPASSSGNELSQSRSSNPKPTPGALLMQGGLSRERGAFNTRNSSVRMVRLCSCCTVFFEVGLGETCAMLQRRGA